MFKKTIFITCLVLLAVVSDSDSKKLSRSRSSGSGRSSSSRKTNPQPAPTSFSYPQPSAQKPSLFGWQEKPAQKTQTYSKQSQSSNQGHSYPSSHTGLSGNNNNQPKQPSSYQENIQRSNVPVQQSAPQSQPNSHLSNSYPVSNGMSGSSGGGYPQPKQPPSYQESIQRSNVQQSAPQQNSHSYPASNGLSGSSRSVGGPQGQGLSGNNVAQPSNQGINAANYNKPLGGSGYPTNVGNNYNNPQAVPPPYSSGGNGYYHHPQGPPPPYTSGHGYGGYGGPGSYSPQAPGYFGSYVNSGRGFGGVSRTGSALTGVGIAGAGIGTVLTGLALWNLARSTGQHRHTVIYDNRGQPIAVAPDNGTTAAVDPILGDLVNCTLTIDNGNSTEIIAIPCSIATSFTPEADVKDVSMNNQTDDKTKCTVTVVTKTGKEFMTTIPCSILLNSAAENNVTESPILDNSSTVQNGTVIENNTLHNADQPSALRLSTADENLKNEDSYLNCTKEQGDIRDPINPCFSVKHDLTVIPIHTTEHQQTDNTEHQ